MSQPECHQTSPPFAAVTNCPAQTKTQIEEGGKCQNRQEGWVRREGQDDSFKACWRSAVGRAVVFRS